MAPSMLVWGLQWVSVGDPWGARQYSCPPETYTIVPPIHRDRLQDPQWMLETVASTEPYMYYVFSYTCIHTYF